MFAHNSFAQKTADTVDIVALGAGPAGTAAAITSAAAGLSVVLLERERFPRPAPGESLHPGVQALLRRLGVDEAVLAAGFLRYPGHLVRWGGGQRFQAFGQDDSGPWHGFQVERARFDAILLERARALGVRIVQPCQVRGLLVAGTEVVGLDADAGPIRARITVDATGRWRALSRWLGLSWTTRGPNRLAWYGYARGSARTGREEVPALTADAGGWTWTARIHADTYQWVRVNLDNSRPPDDWLPAEFAGLTRDGPVGGADVTWRSADRPAGGGYFLVGDAAAVLDPASSHGVLKALMSGMYAGHLSGLVCRHGLPAAAAAERYGGWVREWFDRDVARLGEFYSELRPGTTVATPG